MAHAKKDLRVLTIKQQQLEHPEFYYCVVGKSWFCKICISFSRISSPGIPYITEAGIFGDHHSQRSTVHLESEHQKEAFKNKQSYNTLPCKQTNIVCIEVSTPPQKHTPPPPSFLPSPPLNLLTVLAPPPPLFLGNPLS